MLIKSKIRNNGQDVTIKLPLTVDNDLSGREQAIEAYINVQRANAINPVIDGEKVRFKPSPQKAYSFNFVDNNIYGTSLLKTSITTDEINSGEDVVNNSFYIAQYYTSIDAKIQDLLATSYFNGFDFITNGSSSVYSSNFMLNKEFNNIYLTKAFLEEKTEPFTIYVRYYFFNSKTGGIRVFFNSNNESDKTQNKIYYEVEVNPLSRTYEINTVSTVSLKEFNNANYQNKISDTVDSLSREKPTPPVGQAFLNGGYLDID